MAFSLWYNITSMMEDSSLDTSLVVCIKVVKTLYRWHTHTHTVITLINKGISHKM